MSQGIIRIEYSKLEMSSSRPRLLGISSPEDMLKGLIIHQVVTQIASREIGLQTIKGVFFGSIYDDANIFDRLGFIGV